MLMKDSCIKYFLRKNPSLNKVLRSLLGTHLLSTLICLLATNSILKAKNSPPPLTTHLVHHWMKVLSFKAELS